MKNKILPIYLIISALLLSFTGYQLLIPVLPNDSNTWFSASGKCTQCHNTNTAAMRDKSGNDVSPVSQWRSTMLANASKDPFWRAKVKHEGLENPGHKEGLENVCTRCHAPMGMINAFMNSSGDYTLEQLYKDDLGKDGISCTVCHQINDFSSPEFSGKFKINRIKEIYGPYQNPLVPQMQFNSGYTPVYNDRINDSRLCGSCHTLFTNSVHETGEYTGEVFVEQALYHEWENSKYGEQNISCQSCHMPRLEETIKISSIPPFAAGRQPFGQHVFTGGNYFMLNLMKDNHDALALNSGTEFLDQTIKRTKQMLTMKTIDLSIEDIVAGPDTFFVKISLKNKAGHKFPTGFPSRRAYIELLVSHEKDTLFHSGKRGSGALTQINPDRFEPHYETINNEEQVQIYEFVMGNTIGKVTTILERAHIPLKDNRIVPEGFRFTHVNYDTVKVVGRAAVDADYNSGLGFDRITYAIPASKIVSGAMVRAALHYETVPESWLHELFGRANEDEDISRFKSMYEASDNTPVEVASDTRMIVTTTVPAINKNQIKVYPNPSDGRIRIEGAIQTAGYSVFASDGRQMTDGLLEKGSNEINLNLPSGSYLLLIQSQANPFSTRLIIRK